MALLFFLVVILFLFALGCLSYQIHVLFFNLFNKKKSIDYTSHLFFLLFSVYLVVVTIVGIRLVGCDVCMTFKYILLDLQNIQQ